MKDADKSVEDVKTEEADHSDVDVPSDFSVESQNQDCIERAEDKARVQDVVKHEETVRAEVQNEPPKPSPLDSREARLKAIMEEHLKVIQDQVEEAKNPASYETYSYVVSQADGKVRMYTARRRGNSHFASRTPCQDYCLATSVNGCSVLADADGVGSCEHADIGSRLACEAVVAAVKSATESCEGGEEQLVNRLLSVPFRDRLVSIWKKSVFNQIGDLKALSPADQLKEFCKYGSTIMFAVLTENWIVVGNLGDGQVLVFNEQFGVKLRVHGRKYSTKVRCLINERCVREDFLVARYPRSSFNGVLLSSDGIYESFDKGNIFYSFCIQAKERFLGRVPPCEPYQAFCFKENGEPYKDFSRMRTEDDCSIAMALDEREVVLDYNAIIGGVRQHVDAALLERWSQESFSFRVRKDERYAIVVVSQNDVVLPQQLKSVILDTPTATWCENGWRFSEYADVDMDTIEFMHCTGRLRRDRKNPIDSEQMILNVYLQIRRLEKELSKLGLALNSSALFNMAYDGKALHIRKEAITQREDTRLQNNLDGVEKCFSHLLGVLDSEKGKVPVFDIGYVDRGIALHRADNVAEELGQLLRIDKKLQLKNISSCSWRLEDGMLLPSGESVELSAGMTFTLLDDEGKKQETYNFVSKELL